MFFRKKLFAARSNFMAEYRELMREISKLSLIDRSTAENIYIDKIYEEIIDHTIGIGDEVMLLTSVNKINKITETIIVYKNILARLYRYYCGVNKLINERN